MLESKPPKLVAKQIIKTMLLNSDQWILLISFIYLTNVLVPAMARHIDQRNGAYKIKMSFACRVLVSGKSRQDNYKKYDKNDERICGTTVVSWSRVPVFLHHLL